MAGHHVVALLGILVSLYAVYVEVRKEEDMTYSAFCDIGEWIACSRVFNSKYGRMVSYFGLVEHESVLDQPNAVYGVVYYAFALLHDSLTFLPGRRVLMLLASLLSVGLSVWLGYILMFVLHDLCIVCTTTYVLNALLLYFSVRNLLAPARTSKSKAA